ncbi:DsbA family protein [Rhodothermus profundi]|uniref:Protein-disulfide isomerase n=1 Tax=Rhodothermus profundi TaxID=633813 RepID=A0A1M6PG19_9BACT|nr:thioredoxin domain-containing protein [Rhodothermus profundi]SHK06896.1 Protein-disulfide isomerase [Rhodothermus profundi]
MTTERLQLLFSGILAGCALIVTTAVLYRLVAPGASSPTTGPPFPEHWQELPALPDTLWQVLQQGGHPVGAVSPRATLVAFFDYGCSGCRQIHPTLEALVRTYPTLQLRYRHYPFVTSYSSGAARIALCAAQQGWFETMHRRLLEAQRLDLESLLYDRPARDRKAMERCLYGWETPIDTLLTRDISLARRVGVTGTPTFFLNGRRVPVGVSADRLRRYVQQALQHTPPTP